VLSHQAATSDPSSWTFNVNDSLADIVGGIDDYTNTAASPIDVSAAANDASSTTQALPQVTTTGNAETLVHVVGYNGDTTGNAPAGDTQRISASSLLASLEVSDLYQDQPGPSTAVSATSSLADASEAITVALIPLTSTQRLGYTGQTEDSGFTQSTTGTLLGVTVGLGGGATYSTAPGGSITWSYTNHHGDTITTMNNSGTLTWTGYWGPYGENASGTSPPTNTALTGADYGYNGAQSKLTDNNTGTTLMGARPYQASTGRFIEPDPIEGGCANLYTYGYGDPENNPDLSGEGVPPGVGNAKSGDSPCSKPHTFWQVLEDFGEGIGVGAGVVAITVVTGGSDLVLAGGVTLGDVAVGTSVGVGTVTGIANCLQGGSNCALSGGAAANGFVDGVGAVLFYGSGLGNFFDVAGSFASIVGSLSEPRKC
jgi:RHS repeat-associated protein